MTADPLSALIHDAVRAAVRDALADVQGKQAALPAFLTVGEFAEQCSLSPSKVRAMVRGRAIKSAYYGRCIRIPATEIDRLHREAVA